MITRISMLIVVAMSLTACADVDVWRKCEPMKTEPQWTHCKTLVVIDEKVACEGSCRKGP